MTPAGNRKPDKIIKNTLDEALTEEKSTIERALDLFVSDVSRIPQVVRVEVLQDGEGIDIWTFIEERDSAVRTKIHESQFRLLERFPHLKVDFHVVSNPQRSFCGTQQIYPTTT